MSPRNGSLPAVTSEGRGEILVPAVAGWRDRIAKAHAVGVMAILEACRHIGEARAALGDADWNALLAALPWSRAHSYRLLRIGADRRLAEHHARLPADAYTLYLLSGLPDERFGQLIEQGAINPDMPRKQASAWTKAEARAADRARVAGLAPVAGRFPTLVVDPPWEDSWYSEEANGCDYATMPDEEIAALPVAAWAEARCHLYLWTTNNRVALACEILAGWGFTQRSMLTWTKTTKSGRPKMGRGHYFRNDTEPVIFGTLGKAPTLDDGIRTSFDAPVGVHSEKPETFYRIVRRASPGPAGEAFQGKARAGFVNLFEPAAGVGPGWPAAESESSDA